METKITEIDFYNFIQSCTVQYDGGMHESNGYLNDLDGNRIASIDYDTNREEVEENIFIYEDQYFIPKDGQRAKILEKIDEESKGERYIIKELRSEPMDDYDFYGVSRTDFI